MDYSKIYCNYNSQNVWLALLLNVDLNVQTPTLEKLTQRCRQIKTCIWTERRAFFRMRWCFEVYCQDSALIFFIFPCNLNRKQPVMWSVLVQWNFTAPQCWPQCIVNSLCISHIQYTMRSQIRTKPIWTHFSQTALYRGNGASHSFKKSDLMIGKQLQIQMQRNNYIIIETFFILWYNLRVSCFFKYLYTLHTVYRFYIFTSHPA